jgi:hypothetical protein
MNLIEPTDEEDGQARTIFLFRQPLDETLGQPHLEESALAAARSIVQPSLEQAQVARNLAGSLEQKIGQRIGAGQLMGIIQQSYDVHVASRESCVGGGSWQ